jgi:hypothetical protein
MGNASEQAKVNYAPNRGPVFTVHFSSAMLCDLIIHVTWLLMPLSVRVSQLRDEFLLCVCQDDDPDFSFRQETLCSLV